ncbi:MAG: hypothetical protein O9324_16350 [Microcystis sp. LE19-84.1B]|nr:hypothetical protein [Microcystis sp. LE19-84.1B]MCZ8225468.1 hypothetical protein [Microcystis sp. LE19-84.1B]
MNHFLHSFTVFPDSARKSRSYSLGKLRRPLIFLFTVGYRFYKSAEIGRRDYFSGHNYRPRRCQFSS